VLNVSLIGDCASSKPLDVDIELAVTVFDDTDVDVNVAIVDEVAFNPIAVIVLAVTSFVTKLDPARSKLSPAGNSFIVKPDPSTINGILFAISLHPHLLFQNEQLLVSCH